jgi:hypothetical protein
MSYTPLDKVFSSSLYHSDEAMIKTTRGLNIYLALALLPCPIEQGQIGLGQR